VEKVLGAVGGEERRREWKGLEEGWGLCRGPSWR
jgi:hypothetical protein